MHLVYELPSSVCLSGITFTHHGLNVLSLPTQLHPAHEGKMTTLTISLPHFDAIKWNQKPFLKGEIMVNVTV